MAVNPDPPIDMPVGHDRRFALALRLAAGRDPDRVVGQVLDELLDGLGGQHAMVAYRRLRALGEQVRVDTVHGYRAAPGTPEGDRERQEAFAATNLAFEHGESVMIRPGDDHLASLCVPLRQREQVVGALYIARPSAFSEEELGYALDIAALLAPTLAQAAAHHAQDERLVHLERLNRVFLTISQNLDLAKVQEMVLHMTMELTKAERAFLLLSHNNKLVFAAGHDRTGPLPPESQETISQTACQKVMDTLERVFIFNTDEHAEFANRHSVMDLKLKSILAVPLIGSSGPIGVLYVDSRNELPAALEMDLLVLGAIASQATILIENAQLLRQATVDGLTGLYIRSYIMNRLADETRRTLRYGGSFSLLVIDVDHFKKLNDEHGHQSGDVALQHVAALIAGSIRLGIDLAGRYGGEEMVVLLPSTDAAGALIAAERVRTAIAGHTVEGPNGQTMAPTVSIGVATLPDVARSSESLFAAADRALYEAKRGGRNRVCVATEA
jgi:diguanylate cyclase (GGDEF)-like protein